MDAVLVWQMILLSLSAFLLGATLVISFRYYRAWTRRSNTDWRGLLPLHVFTVTLSYDFMLVYSTLEMLSRIEDDSDNAVWRALTLGPAYVLGLIAFHSINKYRHNRKLIENV